ncbi:Nonribosomal peptide synthetase 4 [Penicillium brasilianum]|uniref:Nonribosomal peptide synthetase 4 n=1 Tax=Penicillium brasilianum TaxID=104259 RepID=A0A1S9RI82_PENBI|nr:Nonribosomal peptide synthetase 4 [Penicillium brasilianum]
MGFIHIDDIRSQHEHLNGSADVLAKNEPNGTSARSFKVAGLIADQVSTPTRMREEIVLLSWLIVLLRTREDGRISYEWAYQNQRDWSNGEVANKLSTEEVLPRLQDSVGDSLAAVSRHIESVKANLTAEPSSTSLLLSTGSLLESSDGAKNDGVLKLQVSMENGDLNIHLVWHSDNILPYTITRHIESLVDTIEICISSPEKAIGDCLRATKHDLDTVWSWNHELPPTYDFCMHEMISERAREFPDKEAILSWDGALTYSEIDRFSTVLASTLQEAGVVLHDFIPVCFEKSRWTIVAVLAVMKAGGTIVLMDPTLPLARLQNMAKQVNARTMVSSEIQRELASSILPDGQRFVVKEDIFSHVSKTQVLPELPTVPASALMYIIFTSGSTGTPKGVKISHQTYTSSAIPRAKAVGYTPTSRVLDFASYAFDVSIDSMLLTLGNGGCLCIPSDDDRLNDINEVIRKMRINYAGITPSMARILDADVIQSLDILGLGGEAAAATDVTVWGRDTRIVIGYGPCECTIGCTINSSAATGRDYISIGHGNGAAMWIVDPNDHEVLMPVGAVGELLVEGPIVGQGYLNDPDKTAAAFIHDPSWLVTGHKGYPGRQGRLYKTGDLGVYDPDGSGGIVFVGRKDTQVKLRGQRVELGEIESQLNARLPSEATVIAEVIVPQGAGGQSTLVAFVSFQSAKGQEHLEIQSAELVPEQSQLLSDANAEISKVLPRYMVPTSYIPVNYIPTLISGKTDRKRLRQFGATVDLRELDQRAGNAISRELTELEQRLRQAWGAALKLDAEGIRLEDNFFALGGDSLAAMRLVSICRDEGLDLSVTSTFGNPTLSAMAEVVKLCDTQVRSEVAPFSMITQAVESASLEASQACGVDQGAVEDIYPSTPTQESLFTFSLKSVKAYVAQRVACIPEHISLDAWKQAWEGVVATSPILRSRMVQLQDPGLQQVVLKVNVDWKHSFNLDQYLEDDRSEKMHLGQSLARYAIVDNSIDGMRYMVWTVHHVLYDGWSEPVILEKVRNALAGQSVEMQAHMKDFVKFVQDTDEVAMKDFWRQELNGAVGPQFPRLPYRDYLPTPNGMVERIISFEAGAGSPFTLATFIRGAWALVASQYTRSDDVVFGETLTGRDISLPGVEGIVGPLIATVPIRIHVSRDSTVESYLQGVQQSILARTPYQHMGMQNIRKVSRDAQHACEAGTGLVVQPEPEYEGNDLGFSYGDVVREALHFNPYPLMLGCGIRKGGFRVCASFDTGLVGVSQMERVLAQLEVACSQLAKDLSRKVDQISCLPEEELTQIWRRNQIAPLSWDESSGKLRANEDIKQGSAYPSSVVHWVCDPRNPSLLSPIGCPGELWLEGAFLSGETTQSPAWLVAGSSEISGRSGNVQPTGDIVQQQEDGSLIFVGRKDNIVPVQGHAVDIADLETHFPRYLPSSTRAAAAVIQPSQDESSQTSELQLAVFVEGQASEGDTIKLMSESHEVVWDLSDPHSLKTSVCASAPIALVVALKRLDKFFRDSLPTHMVPSTYVVLDKLPTNHSLVNQLGSKIPCRVLDQAHEGLQEAWKNILAQASLTGPENILRSSWAKILGMQANQIDVDDNFFRLGGDSVLAMKLVSSLRAQGHSLTVADIFQHMRLGDAAKRLKVGQSPQDKVQPYKPFSILGSIDIQKFLSEVVQPKLAHPSWSVQDVYPVTDTQALDVRGTIQIPRTSMQYNMLYFDTGIDRQRLFQACRDLVKTHDILRTVFIEENGTFLQVILNELDAPLSTHLADRDLDSFVKDLCAEDVDSDFQLGSPFFKFIHVAGDEGKECLVLGISHALYDGMSLPKLLQDLEALYIGKAAVNFEPFSSYMARIRDIRFQTKSLGYWSTLLDGSSLSVLDGTSYQPGDKGVFKSKPVESYKPLEDITTANLLTAAWALLLARRLKKSDVTFGGVTSGRMIELANVENVVGPCYQLTPIRVQFEAEWTASNLLQFVQKQSAESAAHDFLGFDKIAKQCTSWPLDTQSFDSIVHYQDFDDFDTMPFAEGSCRVEISNPHGDAPYPFKVVSFVRGGNVHVGAVGSERDSAVVVQILDDLATTVAELSKCSSDVLLDGELF